MMRTDNNLLELTEDLKALSVAASSQVKRRILIILYNNRPKRYTSKHLREVFIEGFKNGIIKFTVSEPHMFFCLREMFEFGLLNRKILGRDKWYNVSEKGCKILLNIMQNFAMRDMDDVKLEKFLDDDSSSNDSLVDNSVVEARQTTV